MYARVVALLLLFAPSATPLYANSAPIPPVYLDLKDLHLTTVLVENGRAAATIVVPSSGIYDTDAVRIQRAILARPVGYFGWNSISKHMAMYYMTGEEHHAREFLRLAFPDAEAKARIASIDGERIENKDQPLSGPYHYTAHMF